MCKRNENLNENSIFELASCSKQFTAMGILILRDRGKLNLDDKITKYFPSLSRYNQVSIRNLLIHTGGIPEYLSIMDTTWDKHKIAVNKDVINMLNKYQPRLLFVPGTKHEYSNTGYVLLASIIEQISKQTYAHFLKSVIFDPLKMNRTLVYNRRLFPQKIDNYAFGYIYLKSERKYILPDNYDKTKFVYWLDGIVGDGTVNSTVIDLLKWDRGLYTTKLISQKSMNEMFTNGKLNDGTDVKHGFGWRVLASDKFGKIARHTGGWPGYASYIERDLNSDKTIIILQNHNNVYIPSDEIQKILYEAKDK